MGNSPFNCLRSADKTSNQNKQLKSTDQFAIVDPKLWKQLLGIMSSKQEVKFVLPDKVTHKTFKHIQKDITRTYPQSSFFNNNKTNMSIFQSVLRKLALYFPKMGYTQGINFLAGYLLLTGFTQGETFTMCIKIFTNYDLMCLGLYEDEFPLNRLYCSLVWLLLSARSSKTKVKLDSFGIFDDLWLFQWFTTFFIYSFPFELINQLWTYVFLRKQFAFVRIATAIILELEPLIAKCQNQIDFMNLTADLKNYEKFNKILQINKILKSADLIQNQQIAKLLHSTELEHKNKYCAYFIMSENDRKIKYLETMAELAEQRQQFLKNPQIYKFDRSQNNISILDSIEESQAKLLHQSFTFNRKSSELRVQLMNKKLWKSDLQKLPQPQHQALSKQNDEVQAKQTTDQNETGGFMLRVTSSEIGESEAPDTRGKQNS